jgi:hypothetical protein
MAKTGNDAGIWRRHRWRIAGWGFALALLLLPLVAMQFSSEVNWTAFDFIFFATMLAVVGGVFELAARATSNTAYRAGAAMGLLAAFLLVWVNGAVGIIGDENNLANLMYFGVLLVGIIGAILARGKSRGMARTMLATAIAQVLVGVIALATGMAGEFKAVVVELSTITFFFTGMWLMSAWFFSRSTLKSG